MEITSPENNPGYDDRFEIEAWHARMLQVKINVIDVKPFAHVYAFVKNNKAMTAFDFKEMSQAIHDILDAQGVNYGILMFMQGTYVFTEAPVDLNPLVVKLTTGINFNGEVTSTVSSLFRLNKQLGR